MPKKLRRSRRRKGRKHRKKHKKVVEVDPPPLHELTKLFNLLHQKVKQLNKVRLLARDKRIEAWYLTREMRETKADNAIFREHLVEKVDDLQEVIYKIMLAIEEEREQIRKEVERLSAILKTKLQGVLNRTEVVQAELEKVQKDLEQYEPLMVKLAALLQRLEQLQKDIEAAELEADIKQRHLKNQYLWERSKLHNHLESQLFHLIKHLRSYLMPILWNFMKQNRQDNICLRHCLTYIDQSNVKLLDLRDDLLMTRRRLGIEKHYADINWALTRIVDIHNQRTRNSQKRTSTPTTPIQSPPPDHQKDLEQAFQIYLDRQLAAYRREKSCKLRPTPSCRFDVLTGDQEIDALGESVDVWFADENQRLRGQLYEKWSELAGEDIEE